MDLTKKRISSTLILLFCLLANLNGFSQGSLYPYYSVTVEGDFNDLTQKIENALKDDNFEIIGAYNPAKDSSMKVMVFTRTDLKELTSKIKDRGLLAAALKISLQTTTDGKIQVAMVNPQYAFYSYLRHNISSIEADLINISMDAQFALRSVVKGMLPHGGESITESELKVYRFMVRDPSFAEPIVLANFNSFEEGIAKVESSLNARKGNTLKVYKIILEEEKIAVFGIGLLDERRGEKRFLSILDNSHIACLPWEIVLNDTELTMLDGMFRFPLFWPNITVRDFSKLRTIPRDIEETMKALAK